MRSPSFRPLTCSVHIAMLVAITGLMLSSENTVLAQTFPSHEERVEVDSKNIYHDGGRSQVIWEETIELDEAVWLRLYFDRLVLAHDVEGNTSSILRITSLEDGAVQTLDAKTAKQWSNTSAYFNGNSVKLELIAPPNGRMNRVSVKQVDSGEVPPAEIARSICGNFDDRTLSTDPRMGRTLPGGCTAWLFNDRKNCLLTAGHCADSTSVVEFNVPVSSSNGSYNHPSPQDQYPVDQSSMQFIDGGTGNDWCYFGCFNNSNTGLSPFEAQNDSFTLELPQAVSFGDTIRVTGYGTTDARVDPSFNGAQKTQTGPYSSFTGTTLRYRTDTTGGNSGSPIIFENDGTAIGIHTHGGCSSTGGSNRGTGANNTQFRAALANPLGVCQASIDFEFPFGRPEKLDPSGGTAFRVRVRDSGLIAASGTGLLHVDSGSGFEAFPMIELADNEFDAIFPATPCGLVVNYYVSIQTDQGESFSEPSNGPTSSFSAFSATSCTVVFADNFESSMGWTVSSDADDGQWDRGVPAGAGDRGDATVDGDGSGSCFLTDNVAGNSDVDDGSTTLTSPSMDASVGPEQVALLSYYRWYNNAAGASPEADIFEIEISNDDGANWVPLETVGPTGSEVSGGWIKKRFLINNFVAPTSNMRIRFIASDLGEGSLVEAGVDGVEIQIADCENLAIVLGDCNQDGDVNFLDIQSFISILSAGDYLAEADITGDGLVDFLDIAPLIEILAR